MSNEQLCYEKKSFYVNVTLYAHMSMHMYTLLVDQEDAVDDIFLDFKTCFWHPISQL